MTEEPARDSRLLIVILPSEGQYTLEHTAGHLYGSVLIVRTVAGISR